MSDDSIASRVVRATTLVAVLSAVTLSAVAGLTAGLLWRASENARLAELAAGVREAARKESDESSSSLEVAAPEALEDLATLGFQVELWKGDRLLAVKPEAPVLGPRPVSPPGWLTRREMLGDGVAILVAHPREHEARALRVLGLSLAVALPACLLIAWATGRYAARRATSRLTEFTEGLGRIETLTTDGLAIPRDSPREVREATLAFRDLMERVSSSLSREVEFAANASHELRTPLTRIRLLAERALRGASSQGRLELAEQLREIDRMVRLVDSLLVLARDSQSEPHGRPGESVNLADLVRGIAAQVPGDGAATPTVDSPDEAIVVGDEGLLRIAVENLIDNARKFAAQAEEVRVSLTETGGRVRLTVAQPGEPIADRERVFERFYRGEPAAADHPGHGLGLSLARHIARLHGGDVTCEDGEPGEIRFTLVIPAWQPSAER